MHGFSYDGVTDLSTAECYDPMTNTWQYITPMGTKRSCLGIWYENSPNTRTVQAFCNCFYCILIGLAHLMACCMWAAVMMVQAASQAWVRIDI